MVETVNQPEANPPVKADFYTEELLEKIKQEHITIDPTVWSLLTHVLGNRTYAVTLNLEDFLQMPKWILNAGSYLIIFLCKISGQRGKAYTIQERLQRAVNNCYQIKDFILRLRAVTKKEIGF
ncbi:MAG: hypothetical protein Q8N85_02215 [Candidatus Omnitrophota bacterium]|nr:hypothetical protein [Candidatus Omnitrophota bacterium]